MPERKTLCLSSIPPADDRIRGHVTDATDVTSTSHLAPLPTDETFIASHEPTSSSPGPGAVLRCAQEELRECHVRLGLQRRISAGISSELPVGELIACMIREIAEQFPAYRVLYATLKADHRLTVLHSAEPAGAPSLEGAVVDMLLAPEHVGGARLHRQWIASDVEDDPRLAAVRPTLRTMAIRAVLAVPLAHSGQFVGMVAFTAPQPHHWSEHEIATLFGVAHQLSLAQKHAQITADRERLEGLFRQSQKMEAIGCLAGGIAHDFNNLLAVIGGYSRMLADGSLPDDAARRRVEGIRQAAEKGVSLTSQLLTFSRKETVSRQILDLNEVVAHLEGMLRQLIGEDVELISHLSGDTGAIEADAGQIAQVVLNLAVNARDAMPRGGVLVIETKNVERGASGSPKSRVPPRRFVRLTVRDTGCGMDAATRSRIFEPFFTTKGPGEGSGLGLATVYDIVEKLGGTILVDSAPAAGAAFNVYLPRLSDPASADCGPGKEKTESTDPFFPPLDHPGRPAVPVRSPQSTTVLLAEDDTLVRELVQDVLALRGYNVLVAGGTEEARQLADEHPGRIHLLVTDVVMPGPSGRELAEAIRKRRPEMRVLFMSGYSDDAMERHGVSDRTFAFLKKPFTPDALLSKVREVLE